MMDHTAQDRDERPVEKKAKGARTEVVAPFAVNGDTEVRGTVRIAPAVLIELIELTVSDIPGVVELRQRRRRKASDSGETIGKSYDDGKVRVSVAGDQIEADISIAVSVGTNISELASRVQKQVGIAAGRMLGMTVKTVNIYIDDIVEPAT
jgi:uncharacterized alkaline shock family protein YloU